ncbi:MAG: DUF1573 domain-containing protein [Bacteroidales bacterium]|nr:DUF1573 domain-containing protein [Bacteroidales bacterium]
MLYRVLYTVLILTFVAVGCKRRQSDRMEEEAEREEQTEAPPKISFEQVYYDFGNIRQGEKVSYSFQYENTGDSPLVIEEAFASCGCTVPEYDKEPILPGEKGNIEVIFDSSGRRGNQYKSVIIKTNAPESKNRLTIKANVLMN